VKDQTLKKKISEEKSPVEEQVDVNTPPGLTHHSRHPTLRIDAIFGETDWMDPSPWYHFESHKLLEAKIHVLGDCGHQMILEQPEKFGKKIGKITSQCYRDFFHLYLRNNSDSKDISEMIMTTETEMKTPDEKEDSKDSSEEPAFRGRAFGERG